MSKNLTRKGLALGAIVALGSSLFAGTAANAADELTLAPSAGTLYKTIAGESFQLNLGLAPATPSGNIGQLAYQVVTDPAYGSVTATLKNAGTTAANTPATPAGTTNTTVYYLTTASAVGASNGISLASTVSGTTAGSTNTAVVTAFFDADGDHALDAGEYSSAARTITWVRAADVTATVEMTQPSAGDTTASVTAVLDGINQDQLPTATEVAFRFTTGADGVLGSLTATLQTTAAATTEDIEVASYSAATGKFSATSNTIASPITAGTSIKATAYYLQKLSGTNTAQSFVAAAGTAGTGTWLATGAVKLGTVTKGATARTIASVTTSAAASENNTAGTTATSVRANSAFTVSAKVVDAYDAAVAGVSVTALVTSSTALATNKTVTVNGTVVNTGTTKTVTLTSDASGVVKVDLATAGLTATAPDYVTVAFSAQGFSQTITATIAAAAYDVYEVANTSASTQRSVVKGSPITLNYKVLDQWKKEIADGAYRLKATTTAGAALGAGETFANVTGGAASFSYTPTETGTFTVAITAQTNASGSWASYSPNSVPATITVNSIAAQTDAVTAAVAYASATTTSGYANIANANVAAAAVVATDTRLSRTAKGSYTPVEAAGISGVVTQDVTGVVRAGAVVTVSGKGLLFSNAQLTSGTSTATVVTGAFYGTVGTIYSLDSITVIADVNGAYKVSAFSNVAGSFTVSVTSGNAVAVTKTVKFVSTLAAYSVAIVETPAQAQAGRSLDVSAQVSDKYGNASGAPYTVTGDDGNTAGAQAPVNAVTDTYTYAAATARTVSFVLTGAGYLQSTGGDVSATNKGLISNRVISLVGDLGTSTITASFTDAADSTVTRSATKSVEFGITDVTDISSAGKAIYVNTEFAKGKVVTVYIDGKRMPVKALEATDNAVERKYTQKKAGKHTVTVRVSGGVVASETVVTTK